MKKIITMVIAVAMIMACAVSAAGAESMYNVGHDEIGNKDNGAYGEYELLGANADGGIKCDNTGIGVEGKAEAHAFQTTGQLKHGNEEYSVCAQGTVTTAGANAGAGIGAGYDENGNVKVGANVSAEAVAVEAKGKVSSSVGGVEAAVTGGVKVGVGVKGECSFENGKLKCELGASLGLGAEVGFELDFSGLMGKKTEPAEPVLDLHGPAVTGPEVKPAEKVEIHNTNADGIHTTFASF